MVSESLDSWARAAAEIGLDRTGGSIPSSTTSLPDLIVSVARVNVYGTWVPVLNALAKALDRRLVGLPQKGFKSTASSSAAQCADDRVGARPVKRDDREHLLPS
jgi:hypothetical protein